MGSANAPPPSDATGLQAPLGNEGRDRSGRLHGRRAGRALRQAQRARLDQLLPRLSVDLEHLGSADEIFGPAVTELRLEIGFGGGEHLVAEAERNPLVGYIGCEPFRNGIAKLAQQVEARGLDNIRLFGDDAALLLTRLPDACIAEVDLLYPDPWPKRRQRKRRFVSDESLRDLARVMRPGSELRFATDIDDYAAWTLARVLRSQTFGWAAEAPDQWRRPWRPWTSTRYEAKAVREGRAPVYLTFVRV